MNIELSKALAAQLRPATHVPADARYVFDAFGSLVVAGQILNCKDLNEAMATTSGSESWFSEESDFFRFDANGELHSIALKVPGRNATLPLTSFTQQDGFFSLHLTGKQNFIVEPQSCRFFDAAHRNLYAFSPDRMSPDTLAYRLTPSLSILINHACLLSGWVLHHPLENLASHFDEPRDVVTPDAETYATFFKFLDLFSDNQCDDLDQDIEAVTRNLIAGIDQEDLLKVKGSLRQSILRAELKKLFDHYLQDQLFSK